MKKYERKLDLTKANDIELKYFLGDAIVGCRKSLKSFLTLPFTLLKIKNYFSKKSSPEIYLPQSIHDRPEAIVFMPTNGAGLGHLTRTLAVARRLKRLSPEKEIIFFSTSPAMHLVLNEGFLGYHIPSKMICPEYMTSKEWNDLLKTNLLKILSLHNVKKIVFDGAYPYAGLLGTVDKANNIEKIWIKRGKAKANQVSARDEKDIHFNKIIIPGEMGEDNSKENGKYLTTNPIIYLDYDEAMTKEHVRKMWGILDSKIVVYVQLGAGNIDDIHSTLGFVISELKKIENVIIVLGESIIGKPKKYDDDNIIVIRDYPNSKYFKGFDFAISATGYNTYHELVYFQVPTIFIPNMQTKTDDQYQRAKMASDVGVAITLTEVTTESLNSAIQEILSKVANPEFSNYFDEFNFENGAEKAAQLILMEK